MENKQENKHEDLSSTAEDKEARINRTLKELEEAFENTSRLYNAEAKLQKVIASSDQLLMQMPENNSLLLEEIIKELSRKYVDDNNFNTQLKKVNKENGYTIYKENEEDVNKHEENNERSEKFSLSETDTILQDYANDSYNDKEINELLETEEQFKKITLGNAKAKVQDNTNYIGQLEQENIDLKTQCEYLQNKARLRENELLLRIQEYADEKNKAGSSGISSDRQVEDNESMESTIKDTEKPDQATTVSPKIQQTFKKTFDANKELLHFKKSTKTDVMNEILMEQAEKRSMEVTHGFNELNPMPSDRFMQIKRERRHKIYDLRRDIDNDIQKFVISRHYHYHHYHYHHHL